MFPSPSTPLFCLATILLAGCPSAEGPKTGADAPAARTHTLVLAAYTTPREVYEKEVIPAFQAAWKKDHPGEDVKFETSYQGSGAQSRAVVGGLEADVVALSLEADVTRIQEAGLITRDWKAGLYGGMVSSSIACLAVRQGNPKGVQDWADLARTDLEVLTPNVRTSGGAMWNVAAVYGAAFRGHTPAAAGDDTAAEGLLAGILARVKIMDKGARESMITFEKGVGDVAITYENEVLSGRLAGQTYDYVVPKSTILIVNPIAVVDANTAKHGTTEVADAFVQFTLQPDAQRAFARYGYRPVEPGVLAETAARFPVVQDLFRIEDLGGWPEVTRHLFDQGTLYDRALLRAGGDAGQGK